MQHTENISCKKSNVPHIHASQVQRTYHLRICAGTPLKTNAFVLYPCAFTCLNGHFAYPLVPPLIWTPFAYLEAVPTITLHCAAQCCTGQHGQASPPLGFTVVVQAPSQGAKTGQWHWVQGTGYASGRHWLARQAQAHQGRAIFTVTPHCPLQWSPAPCS